VVTVTANRQLFCADRINALYPPPIATRLRNRVSRKLSWMRGI
jgi:hypothetical protein